MVGEVEGEDEGEKVGNCDGELEREIWSSSTCDDRVRTREEG